MDSHVSVEDRQFEADNTYILAIDGDSKFEPSAVMKLLRLMNVKNEIGCACGRIHPIGEGYFSSYLYHSIFAHKIMLKFRITRFTVDKKANVVKNKP